jgi:hypothetical protein
VIFDLLFVALIILGSLSAFHAGRSKERARHWGTMALIMRRLGDVIAAEQRDPDPGRTALLGQVLDIVDGVNREEYGEP